MRGKNLRNSLPPQTKPINNPSLFSTNKFNSLRAHFNYPVCQGLFSFGIKPHTFVFLLSCIFSSLPVAETRMNWWFRMWLWHDYTWCHDPWLLYSLLLSCGFYVCLFVWGLLLFSWLGFIKINLVSLWLSLNIGLVVVYQDYRQGQISLVNYSSLFSDHYCVFLFLYPLCIFLNNNVNLLLVF